MDSKKKIDIIEDQYALNIKFRWFSSSAFFVSAFCIAWFGFLAGFYSMLMGDDVPWMVYLFPVVHIAAGIGILYFNLCQYFNKTEIEVTKDYIVIENKPIAIFKKYRKIPVNEIDQIFVQEEKTNSDNSTSYTYKLSARLRNVRNVELVGKALLDKDEALVLEELIEKYLGIQDAPVKGEVRDSIRYRRSSDEVKKRISVDAGHPLRRTVGDVVLIDGLPYHIESEMQYDWDNGITEKQFFVKDDNPFQTLLYIGNVKGQDQFFHEKEVSAHRAFALEIDDDNVAPNLTFGGKNYYLIKQIDGRGFLYNHAKGIPSRQYFYQTLDMKHSLRIIKNRSTTSYFEGELCDVQQEQDASDYLDLEQPIIELKDNEDYV